MEEMNDITKDPEEILFISFVSMLYNSGIQQLGKIMNPITGTVHKDLSAVHSTIEILRMLRTKAKGNLSEKEQSVLDASISNLQMNYIEELEVEKKEAGKKTESDAAAEETKKASEEKK